MEISIENMHTDVWVLRVERKLFIGILPVIDSFSETISWDIFISATFITNCNFFVCLFAFVTGKGIDRINWQHFHGIFLASEA